MYSENYETLMKETEKYKINVKRLCAYGLVELILSHVYPTQSNQQIQDNPYQNAKGIFHRTRQITLKFVRNWKRTQVTKAIMRKKNKAGGLPDFKLFLQSYSN